MAIALPQEVDQDQDLLEAIASGDAQALTEFIGRNERWVRGVVYAAISDPNVLDDVMQKIWLSVWQRLTTLEDMRRWRHWLYRMARNAAIDFGRKKQRRRNLFQRVTHEVRGGAGPRGEIQPVRQLAVREEHQRVLDAVHAMPAIYKEPFVLRHLEGWSYKRIAQTLELPVDTVGTRLVRARRLLQETLGGEKE